MKVAYIVGGFPTTSETFVVNQIAGMVARGCEVQIFATTEGTAGKPPAAVEQYRLMERLHRLDAPKRLVPRVVKVARMLMAHGWRAPGVVLRSINVPRYGRIAATFGLLYAALVLIRDGARNFDVVHAQFGPYGLLAVKLIETGALSGKLVVSFRGYDATKVLRANPQTYIELFRNGALFLPVSHTVASRLVAAGCDMTRIRVHHSGIDCAEFRHSPRTRARREVTNVLMVGRLVEKKGIGTGIAAIARVVSAGRAVLCTIIGEGPLRADLERLIEQLGVGAHVRLVGPKSHENVLHDMVQSHVLLAPSVTAADGDEEGIPNTLKEAMAMSLPVVATMHAGIPELVVDGVSGFLVPEHDVDALAARLIQLIDDPGRCAIMGREGRRAVETEFDIEKLNVQLLELYRNVVGMSPQPAMSDHARAVQSVASPDPQSGVDSTRSQGTRYH